MSADVIIFHDRKKLVSDFSHGFNLHNMYNEDVDNLYKILVKNTSIAETCDLEYHEYFTSITEHYSNILLTIENLLEEYGEE